MYKVGDFLELKSHPGKVIRITKIHDNGRRYDCIPISGYSSREDPWYDQALLPRYWNLVKPPKKKVYK